MRRSKPLFQFIRLIEIDRQWGGKKQQLRWYRNFLIVITFDLECWNECSLPVLVVFSLHRTKQKFDFQCKANLLHNRFNPTERPSAHRTYVTYISDTDHLSPLSLTKWTCVKHQTVVTSCVKNFHLFNLLSNTPSVALDYSIRYYTLHV